MAKESNVCLNPSKRVLRDILKIMFLYSVRDIIVIDGSISLCNLWALTFGKQPLKKFIMTISHGINDVEHSFLEKNVVGI